MIDLRQCSGNQQTNNECYDCFHIRGSFLLSPSTRQTIGCSVGNSYFNRKRIPAAAESFGQSKRFCGDPGSTIPSKAGWSWGCVSAIDSNERTIWIADRHRDEGKCYLAYTANGRERQKNFWRLLAQNCTMQPCEYASRAIKTLRVF
jgi:hypothetical protein